MAYLRDDELWCPTSQINDKQKVDFYSQLKRKYDFLQTGVFVSTQGMNVSEVKVVGEDTTTWTMLTYDTKLDEDDLRKDTKSFVEVKFPNKDDAISQYLAKQEDIADWGYFCAKYKIKNSPEFQKVLIELGIKNWVRESLQGTYSRLPILPQTFTEQQFFAIYVRSPRGEEAKAVAVKFVYKDGAISLEDVLRDMQQIRRRFPFLRTIKHSPDDLKDNQQYFVDEESQIYISCYTDDYFTPTLIGKEDVLSSLENGTLEINRRQHNLLPLVLHYNDEIGAVRDLICLDLSNHSFIQYFVPPRNIRSTVRRGYRVYHLIGKHYGRKAKESIPTSELIKHPIVALHFSTLTQNVLKTNDNSQSSLLQKVAKVLIEN